MRLFDIFYTSFALFLLPFHTFFLVYVNLKYLKYGYFGKEALINFTRNHSILSYFFAIQLAILLIPIYLFFYPMLHFKALQFPFILIDKPIRFHFLLILLNGIIWLLSMGIIIECYTSFSIFNLILFPFRIYRYFKHVCLQKRRELRIFGLSTKYRIPSCFFTKVALLSSQ